MSDTKSPPPNADALAKQLKDSLARRRLRPWKIVLGAMVGGILFLTLVSWWLYPRPKPAPLQIIALDVVCTPDDTPRARAQLLAPPDDTEPRSLSGRLIVFHEQRLVLPPNEKPRSIETKSDAHGQASVEWPVEKAAVTDFLAMFIDPEERKGSPRELGRIFVWPKDAPVLIVDLDETLIAEELDAKAAETLTRAAKEGWRIIYLTVASNQASDLRAAHGWISKHQGKVPVGPVLGRPHFNGDETAAQARREVLQSLHGQFKGKVLAVVKNAGSAEISKEIGLPTILIGDAAAPAEVIQAPTWADVVVRLE